MLIALAFAAALSAPPQAAPEPAPPLPLTIRRAADAAASLGSAEAVYLSPDGAPAVGQIVLTEPPGYRTPMHVHHETDESFYVLTGSLTLHVGGETRVLGPGDYVFIPRGTPHAQGNTGEAPSRLLVTLAPGDFTGFFHAREELVKTSPPGHPDYVPRMMALGQTYDIQVLGEPPF